MELKEEIKLRLKRKNQVLFAKDSEYLQDLIMPFESQNHRVMVLWALDFAEESVHRLEAKYPEEQRPRIALQGAWNWASGKIKMREAQRKILDCHAFAKEIDDKEYIAVCHSIGQACAVVHTAGHAIGYPIYDLTSLVYKYGAEECEEKIRLRKKEYIDRLFFHAERIKDYKGEWADFLMR